MRIEIYVSKSELEEMELNPQELKELIYESDVADDLVGFDVDVYVEIAK